MRVHADRLGGRSRLDASRVFRTGRSQGLVEREGASREEAQSTVIDAGHGWTEGETVREFTTPIRSLWIRPAGFGLQTLYTTEGTLGLPVIKPLRARWYGILEHVGEAS